MANSKHYDCAVIGNWHLAFLTATCLAHLGRRVALVNDEENGWHEFPVPPVYEPGLAEMIERCRSQGSLSFEESLKDEWSANYVWIAIDTPVNSLDQVDTTPVEQAIKQTSLLKKSRTVIVSSQVPLGFCNRMERETGCEMVYVPENLQLGKGIETFLKAGRTVIGASEKRTSEKVRALLEGVESDYLLCDLQTAEMVKHATNAFLATSISFANELARIGEKFGVDNQAVATALRMDKRIGKRAYVVPGLGFAGGTLPRDLRILQELGARAHVETPLVDAVLHVNEQAKHAVLSAVTSHCGGSVKGKKILILGYTYKEDTDTLRRSLSVEVARLFASEGAQVWGYDPIMNGKDLSEFGGSLTHCNHWSEVSVCPDVIVVMTPREAFRQISWSAFKSQGVDCSLILDVRAALSSESVLGAGFSYKALWQPVVTLGQHQQEVHS